MTRRLVFTYLSFALLILAALSVPLGYFYQRSETQHAFGQLEHDAEVLAAFVDTVLSDGPTSQISQLAQEAAQRLGGQVDIVDGTGAIMASTHPQQHSPNDLADAPDIRTVLSSRGQISTRTGEFDGMDIMSVAVAIHPGEVQQGVIRVSVPMEPLDARIRNMWYLLAVSGAGILFAVALVGLALARWISRPVLALEQATRGFADGRLTPLVPSGPPELRRLAATFAATAARLQALIDSQRSFIGAASHQLKTPLAAMRLRLENLEPDISASGGENLRAALTETDRLAQMVEMLLAVARSDQAAMAPNPIRLAEAVKDAIELWSPLAAESGVTLVGCGDDDVQVFAVTGAVGQIIDNLLSNALRAAPADSTITVTWRGVENFVELHVIDHGPGLSAEQRVRALDPFWRAPDAPKGGTGLGLSLVRKLAELSGGGASLEPAAGSGIDAVVTFPAEKAGL